MGREDDRKEKRTIPHFRFTDCSIISVISEVWVISTKPLYTHFLRRAFSSVFLLLPDLQIHTEKLSQPTLEGMRQPGNVT